MDTSTGNHFKYAHHSGHQKSCIILHEMKVASRESYIWFLVQLIKKKCVADNASWNHYST